MTAYVDCDVFAYVSVCAFVNVSMCIVFVRMCVSVCSCKRKKSLYVFIILLHSKLILVRFHAFC